MLVDQVYVLRGTTVYEKSTLGLYLVVYSIRFVGADIPFESNWKRWSVLFYHTGPEICTARWIVSK